VKFGIENENMAFLPQKLPLMKVSQQLLTELSDSIGLGLASKKAKSELIVIPILKEFRRNNINQLSFFFRLSI
jgi:hypothetical protein